MFPTLGHLINAIFGTDIIFPLPTYGFVLACAFLSGFVVLKAELKRKWKENILEPTYVKVIRGKGVGAGDIATYAFFGFLLGWKIIGIVLQYQLFAKDVQGYVFSLEGSIFGGVVVGAIFAAWHAFLRRKEKLPEPFEDTEMVPPQSHAATILLIAAVSGIVGAKIFHQLENFQEFLRDPVGHLFSAGGLTFYGGLIFGVIAVLWYAHSKKISWKHILDVAAPAVILAYGIGRIGCMLSGDGCWGVANLNPKPEWLAFLPDWMWSFNFPHNVINEGVPIEGCSGYYCHVLPYPVWPTPFYETTISLAIFFMIWGMRKIIKAPGALFALFLVLSGIERFFIEKIRVNNKFTLGNITFSQAELIAVILVVVGIAGMIIFIRHRKKKLTEDTVKDVENPANTPESASGDTIDDVPHSSSQPDSEEES